MKIRNFSPLIIGVLLVCLPALGSCQKNNVSPNAYTMDKDASYAFGMYLAMEYQVPDMYYDYNALIEGFRAVTEMKDTKFSMETAVMKINEAFSAWAEKNGYGMMNDQGGSGYEGILEEGLMFLADNGRRPGVTTTASGLQYEVITEGTGAKPSASDTVRVHYEGTLINGNVFDSSYARGEPIEFPLNGVIRGWTEGVQLMSEGSVYRLFIPADLGYGANGAGSIPPYSALIFTVELIAVVK